jgi:hypothetical protein
MDIGCEVGDKENPSNKAFFVLDEVNPKVSIFRDFNEKSLSGGSYAHIINEMPNLFKPCKLWAFETSSRHKKKRTAPQKPACGRSFAVRRNETQ